MAQRKRMMAFYSQFLGRGDLCFDVGANVGERTDVFSRLGARVVAIEPQGQCADRLERRFGRDKRVTVLRLGLSDHIGRLDMHVANQSTISTMSESWRAAVTQSGRFSTDRYHWAQVASVPVTTLDCLIGEHGMPDFVKIDVEGYESPVLRGLSRPVRCLSFEFVPEFAESTFECVRHLAGLGPARFNYSLGESMELSSPEWVEAADFVDRLLSLPDKSVFGDVYAKLEV